MESSRALLFLFLYLFSLIFYFVQHWKTLSSFVHCEIFFLVFKSVHTQIHAYEDERVWKRFSSSCYESKSDCGPGYYTPLTLPHTLATLLHTLVTLPHTLVTLLHLTSVVVSQVCVPLLEYGHSGPYNRSCAVRKTSGKGPFQSTSEHRAKGRFPSCFPSTVEKCERHCCLL